MASLQAHVELPSDKEIRARVLAQKKRELMMVSAVCSLWLSALFSVWTLLPRSSFPFATEPVCLVLAEIRWQRGSRGSAQEGVNGRGRCVMRNSKSF